MSWIKNIYFYELLRSCQFKPTHPCQVKPFLCVIILKEISCKTGGKLNV